jgi:hypothetical protein
MGLLLKQAAYETDSERRYGRVVLTEWYWWQ